MRIFKRIKIGTQLALGFGAVIAISLTMSMFSIVKISTTDDAFELAEKINLERLAPLFVARESLGQTGISARNAFIFSDPAEADAELNIIDMQKTIYIHAIEKLSPIFSSDPDFNRVKTGLMRMSSELTRPRKYRKDNDMQGYAKFLTEECTPLRRQIVKDMGVLITKQSEKAISANGLAGQSAKTARNWIFAQAFVTVIGCLIVAKIVTNMLLSQLGGQPGYAAYIANKIADGDLSVKVRTLPHDDSSLIFSIKTMKDNLASIVSQARAGSNAISSASSEIAEGNFDLAHRSENQGESLERIAQAMSELTITVKQNADNASVANELAASASSVSAQGGAVMSQVISTMESIQTSSKEISEIIGVIDGIAFQTNILALNAAVEAARAGEQGRGFAVVATEVRGLAHRSSSAAKEIKALIEGSVSKVSAGSALVTQAGATMDEVVTSVTQVTQIMREIRSASDAQTVGIKNVGNAITELEGLTQQNTALVEEATAASQELNEQAVRLVSVVGAFKL